MKHTYLEYTTVHGEPCFLVVCDHPGCTQLAAVVLVQQMLCPEHAAEQAAAPDRLPACENESVEVRGGELTVHYKGSLNTELDQALEECLAEFGYQRWASGREHATDVRDLAFAKERPPCPTGLS